MTMSKASVSNTLQCWVTVSSPRHIVTSTPPKEWMVRPSPTLMATVLLYRKCCTGVKHRSKILIPDFHEDPENQVLLFGAAPLLLSREFDIHPCSHEGLGHPGQLPLLGVIPLRGGVIPLWALLGVTFGRRGSRTGFSSLVCCCQFICSIQLLRWSQSGA